MADIPKLIDRVNDMLFVRDEMDAAAIDPLVALVRACVELVDPLTADPRLVAAIDAALAVLP